MEVCVLVCLLVRVSSDKQEVQGKQIVHHLHASKHVCGCK